MRLTDRFDWGSRTYVMGILNVTPDSFSGDGLRVEAEGALDHAMAQARDFVDAGADILDVGGESTRPGSTPLGAEEEKARVLPVISALADEFPNLLISIDTFKSEVAAAALDAGAHIVNDVWGLRADPDMGHMAAERGAPVILMHNRSRPNELIVDQLGGSYLGASYDDLLADVAREMEALAEAALAAGVARDQIILDPGIGFGKTIQQNMALINHIERFKALGYPILSGPSRKSFIGRVLDLPPDQRVEGTAATIALSIVRGADIIRVHDTREMVRVARMMDAMLRADPAGDGA
ncbi:MAG: dihydropteroate synthase [Proteobacteria bacterium]|nr:dihydropteroate synthase [Pseudomonadota bacterium]MCK4866514.1 dihydropteroate synthase [Alphaproteobacteria bacterium]